MSDHKSDTVGCKCPACKTAAFMSMPFGAGKLGEVCPYCAMVGALVKTCGTCKGTGRVVVPAGERGAP